METAAAVGAGLCFSVARRSRSMRRRFLALGWSLRTSAGLEGDRRSLAPRPWMAQGTRSAKRINMLLAVVGRGTYLEIGIAEGFTFESVRASTKLGVDPAPRFNTETLPPAARLYAMPSDEYFDSPSRVIPLDGAFVDGLHEFMQTYRDVIAALARVRHDGFVLIDDVVPLDAVSGLPSETDYLAETERRGMQSGAWMGDVWKVIRVLTLAHADDLEWRTISATNGRMQTLVWKRRAGSVAQAQPQTLLSVSAEHYEDWFSNGVPSDFRTCDWQTAFGDFCAARAART